MADFDPSQYKYFFFDWDGCLVKSLDCALANHHKALSDFGVHANDAIIAKNFGNHQFPSLFGIDDTESFWQRLNWYATEGVHTIEMYVGAVELLAYAKRQGKIAIVSSLGKEPLQKGIHHHSLDTIVDLVISGDDVAEYKPHPEGIVRALRYFDANPSEAIMIGDTEKDVLAAHNAGIDSLLVFPDEHALFYNYEELVAHKPTHVARGLHTIQCDT